MNKRPLIAMVFFLASVLSASAESIGKTTVDAKLLDIFPPAVADVPESERGETTMSSDYSPSGSLWTPGLDERNVFDLLIRHKQDEDNSFDLRVGKGGQIYSLRSSFGESINPQLPDAHWNDGVWQPVCHPISTIYGKLGQMPKAMAEPIKQSGADYSHGQFIHGAGTYVLHGMDSGEFTVSCDVMLDKEKPGRLDVILRDLEHGRPMLTFGTLSMDEGQITLNGKRVAAAHPGEWQHLEISFTLGNDATGTLTAEVRNADGKISPATAPFSATGVRAFTWIGFSAGGDKEGVIYLDNLEVKQAKNGQVCWVLQDDFEGKYEDLPVVGRNPEKGADAVVTESVAASGKRSVEIRDAANTGWQPMVRYILHSPLSTSLYSPNLASDVTGDGRTFRTVHWGLVPQLKTISRSPILYYTQLRDVGDGIIEVTYIFHNFNVRDDIDFGHMNAPWGSTRISSLPHYYVNLPDGELMKYGEFKGAWNDPATVDNQPPAGIIDVRKTGGWNLNSTSEANDAPSLALVFGRDKHLEAEHEKKSKGLPYAQVAESSYRFSKFLPLPDDWRTRPGNSWHNWYGSALLPKMKLTQGRTVWWRFFLVVNSKDRAIKLADSLVDKVDYGMLTFDADSTPKVPVYLSGGKVVAGGVDKARDKARDKGPASRGSQRQGVSSPDLVSEYSQSSSALVARSRPPTDDRLTIARDENGGRVEAQHPAFHLFTMPVTGTMPLFLIENTTTGQEVITTDPYIFVPQEKMNFKVPDGPKWDIYRNAVGYDMRQDKNNSRWKRLLGYGYVKKPADGDFVRLSDAVGEALFPHPTTYHLDLWVERP